jgi:hypothetical protein
MCSDELVSIEIRKVFLDGGLSVRTFIKSEIGYEFNLIFTPEKKGYYALVIEKKSDEKTTIELRAPPLQYGKSRTSDLTEGLVSDDRRYFTAEQMESRTPDLTEGLDRELPRAVEMSEDEAEAHDSTAENIPWRILPPGEHPFPHILKSCEFIKQSKSTLRIATERLELINSLNPSKIYRGLDEFKGYFVFYFEGSTLAILDCPIVGNAVYVIKGDWKTLSRLAKAELLKEYADDVTRVIHSGDWFVRLSKLICTHGNASLTNARSGGR